MKWLQRKAIKTPKKHDTIEERIAKIRGIKDIKSFLNPTSESLHDPYLMKNIQEASNRIIQAVKTGEKIVVSYDPDADGITSATIMLRHLRHYTDKLDYIYGERNDGHGIEEMIKVKTLDEEKDKERIKHNKENTDKIREADLLILVDSSSSDVEACRFIKEELGTDIVILDHHEIEKDNPHVILVNPQQKDCEYPNKYLSGAGVVFKTLQVIEDTLDEVDVWQFIDLVAVGMYADVMRVDVPENRYLILHGLRNIKNLGLIRILKGANADFYKLDGDTIGFKIAPLINGVARMDEIKLAIDILLADDDKICKKLRLKMSKLNEARKEKQKEIVKQYMTKVDDSKKVLIVMDEQSSKGFNGVIAQQLAEKYNRPAIVGRLHEGSFSGSFRSYGDLDLKTFLDDSGLTEYVKGHPQAGGFSVKKENIKSLTEYIEENLPELKELEPFVYYDLEIDASEVGEYVLISEKFNKLTGKGFPKVAFRVNNITIEDVECIGSTMETVKFKTFDKMELIRFKVDENYASELGCFDEIDAVGQLGNNEWYNFQTRVKTVTPQIILNDYKCRT